MMDGTTRGRIQTSEMVAIKGNGCAGCRVQAPAENFEKIVSVLLNYVLLRTQTRTNTSGTADVMAKPSEIVKNHENPSKS